MGFNFFSPLLDQAFEKEKQSWIWKRVKDKLDIVKRPGKKIKWMVTLGYKVKPNLLLKEKTQVKGGEGNVDQNK
jgi:hypothetical protein